VSTPSIEFAGHKFQPQLCGALYWQSENTLIVSDLHFEKASHFARHGNFIPPYDSFETVNKLKKTCDRLTPKRLILLGDVFHDQYGYQRMAEQARSIFDTIISGHELIWIDGNHDRGHAPENVVVHEKVDIAGIVFTHIATDNPMCEISGHYHPCHIMVHKGHKMRRPCFIFNEKKIIMPAFGTLTGHLECGSPAIRSIIPDPHFAVLGTNRILMK
tara:strand:- start:4287 stop:4934 length:648 start_codon:yes stop_codon:yes gene_type:complete